MVFSRRRVLCQPLSFLFFVGVSAGCLAPAAKAASAFNFSYDDGINALRGVLVANDQGGGAYHAIGGSVQVTGPSAGAWSLTPAGPQVTNIDNGTYLVNNLIYPTVNTATDPIVDEWGLLFSQGDSLLNLYIDTPPAYSISAFDRLSGQYRYQGVNLSATVSLTPVPAPLPLLGLGQALLVARRLKKRALATTALA